MDEAKQDANMKISKVVFVANDTTSVKESSNNYIA